MSNQNHCEITDDHNIRAKIHCLVVEDNPDFRGALSIFLERNEIQVEQAENGQVALQKYLDDPEQYDIIIMDLQMPVMNGIEAVRAIRASSMINAATISVIAMTGNDITENIDDSGFTLIVRKPFSLPDMLGSVRRFALKQ